MDTLDTTLRGAGTEPGRSDPAADTTERGATQADATGSPDPAECATAAATAGIAAGKDAVPLRPFFPSVHAALQRAEQAAHQVGQDVLAAAYEEHRRLAIANVEAMLAHGQLALVALRWEAENLPLIARSLTQAARSLTEAQGAVTARTHLDELAGRAQAARAPARTLDEEA